MIVVVDHEIGYSVDGIHREILTEGEYNFDDLPLIAREVCVREEFRIYDPTEVKTIQRTQKRKLNNIPCDLVVRLFLNFLGSTVQQRG